LELLPFSTPAKSILLENAFSFAIFHLFYEEECDMRIVLYLLVSSHITNIENIKTSKIKTSLGPLKAIIVLEIKSNN